MIEYDNMKNKVTLVRSKSDAPLSEISEPDKPFTQGNTSTESSAASLKEPCSDSPVQFHIDDILDAEEAYVTKDLGVSAKEVLVICFILFYCYRCYRILIIHSSVHIFLHVFMSLFIYSFIHSSIQSSINS